MQIPHQALQKQSKEIKRLVCSSQHPAAIRQDKIGGENEKKKGEEEGEKQQCRQVLKGLDTVQA